MSTNSQTSTSGTARFIVIAALIAVAFFVSYRFAVAGNSSPQPAFNETGALPAAYDPSVAGAAGGSCGAGGSGGCCGGGSSTPIEGAAALGDDGVQRIEVDTSAGYDPNVIKLAAGVPTEITFGQGYGCMAQVMSKDLGFFEDLQSGPVTVQLPALEAGSYSFSCGMEMVFGEIVVE